MSSAFGGVLAAETAAGALLPLNFYGCAHFSPIIQQNRVGCAKNYTPVRNWSAEVALPQGGTVRQNRQGMDAVFKTARPVDTQPVGHPDIPGCSVGAG